MPKEKGPKKPKYEVREKRAGPKMSRGRRHFQVGKELREQAESYTEQATAEAEKAGKRKGASAWGSLIGAIGVPLAVLAMSNPLTAFGYLAMAGMAGGGALAGSALGVKGSKMKHGEREDIEVEKFYTEEAEQATEDIKEIDKKTREQAWKSAATSAVLAGFGSAAKAGKFAEGGKMFGKVGQMGSKLSPDALSWVGKAMEVGQNVPLSAGVGKAVGTSMAAATGAAVLKHGYGVIGEKPRTQYEDPYTRNPYRQTNRA